MTTPQLLFAFVPPLLLLYASLTAGCLPYTPGKAEIEARYEKHLTDCFADLERKFEAQRANPYYHNIPELNRYPTTSDRMYYCIEPLAKAQTETEYLARHPIERWANEAGIARGEPVSPPVFVYVLNQ